MREYCCIKGVSDAPDLLMIDVGMCAYFRGPPS
jgi:hypothetical protein